MWIAVFAVLLALAGCHRQRMVEQAELPYKVLGTSDPALMATQARLDKLGIRVITIGQDYMISLPSVVLFPQESPRILWGSYKILNDVVCYLKQFRKVSVTVTAYSNKCASMKRAHALTLARAKAVANYLWSQGIDSRFIFTQGLGSDKPIEATMQGGDKSANSRIEIIFREAVA